MGQCSPLLSAGLHHRPPPPLPAKPCSLQGLATGHSTAIRLIWKHVTFLEKMSQNYRGERWKRFIKAAGPSSCQSTAAPTEHTPGFAPEMFQKRLVMCCPPLPSRALHVPLWWFYSGGTRFAGYQEGHLDGSVASFQLMQPCFLPCQ